MLSDLLQLEVYYGTPEAAQFFEDLSRRYGPAMVRKALRAGEITGRRLHCGPDCGRRLFWLTEKGRARTGH